MGQSSKVTQCAMGQCHTYFCGSFLTVQMILLRIWITLKTGVPCEIQKHNMQKLKISK